jgi:hypothetical protein
MTATRIGGCGRGDRNDRDRPAALAADPWRKEYLMKLKRICMFTLLLGLVSVAGATSEITFLNSFFTPPLVAEGQNLLECHVVNVSDEVRSATIEVRSQDGSVLATGGGTLNPGDETAAIVPGSASPRYCKFLVEGSRLHFRASIMVRMPGLGSVGVLPAQ